MRFLRRGLVGLFLLSLTIGFLVWAGETFRQAVETRMAQEPFSRPAREQVYAVNVIKVVPTALTPVMASFGEIRSRRTLELRASAGGRVVFVDPGFVEGGMVGQGQLLLQVDQADARSSLAMVRADISEGEARLLDAERSVGLAKEELLAAEDQAQLREQALRRQENLLARGAGTEAAVEAAKLAASSARQATLSRRSALANAEFSLDQARNSLERLTINLEEAERNLEATEVRATFDGNLSEVAVVEGGIVSNNERLAQLVDPYHLEVAFRVSNAQYARLLDADGVLRNADVMVSLDVQGTQIKATGKVVRESAAVAEGQTGRLLFASLDASSGLKPGDFVTVRIDEAPLENVVALPNSAVDSAQTVLVVNEQSRLEVRPVEVLRRQGNELIVAADGLAGQSVVAERSPLLGAGIRVRIVGGEPATASPRQIPQSNANTGGASGDGEMISLDEERRSKLIAFVEANGFMPEDVKTRILTQLKAEQVPKQVVERLESRMGG